MKLAGRSDTGLYIASMAFFGALLFFIASFLIPAGTSEDFAARPTPTSNAPQLTAVNVAANATIALAFVEPTPTLEATPSPTHTASITPPPALTATHVAALVTPSTSGLEYIVQYGDTLYGLSQRFGVPMDSISGANNLTDLSQFQVGLRLTIPVDPARFPMGITMPTPNDQGIIYVTATPTAPSTVNNIAVDQFLVIPPNVAANIRRIYARGRELGRDPNAFSKLGDSTIENPHFLARFDEGTYNLGDYAYLEGVIDQFPGSFRRQGPTVRRGLHTWSVLDPMWATGCSNGQHMLACEFQLHNPSFIFIRMGSNDAGVPASTDQNLRAIVEYCIENGVVPIMGTKADRFEGSNINNEIIRKIAQDYELPLWDFDLLAGTIPGRGLGPDNVHMTTFFAHDWRLANAWTTENGVHNLTALIALDRVWQIVQEQ